MANRQAGTMIGRAGRQREQRGGEIWEEEQGAR